MVSQLEQFTLEKSEAAFVVVGNVYGNTVWANHLLDFLFSKAIANPKFSKVIVVACDRDVEELSALARNAVLRSESLRSDRLHFVRDIDLDTFFRDLAAPSSSSDGEETESIVFLYSLSELCLLHGLLKVTSWLHEVLDNTHRAKLGTVLHQSLHDDLELAQLVSLFPTAATIVPNYGTLSDTVVAEVQVLRRSQTTGKMSEVTEMLQWSRGMLAPRIVAPGRKSTSAATVADADDSKLVAQGKASSEGKSAHSEASLLPSAIPASRLVTFDSTDPEFDEDSDPDADLDL